MTLSCGVLLAAVAAQGVVGGTVTLGAENLGWDRSAGCLVANVELTGTDGANAGDLYFNRDAGHSVLKIREFPGLTQVKLDAEGHAKGLDVDFPNTLFPCPVFGNCSRAMTQGPYWRSLPRAMVTTMASTCVHAPHPSGANSTAATAMTARAAARPPGRRQRRFKNPDAGAAARASPVPRKKRSSRGSRSFSPSHRPRNAAAKRRGRFRECAIEYSF